MHRHPRTPVAAGRSLTERRQRLVPLIAYVARRLKFDCARLPDDDRRFLSDAMREEGRYPMAGLDRMLDCAAAATRDEVAFSLPEALRGEIIRRRQVRADVPSLIAAFERETTTQAAADVAEFRYIRDRSETNRVAAIETMTAHLEADRVALDALHAAGGER